ncbi:hypothetical protein AOL_s00078g450 [Orbilia oligospora ATCC 24927]|uniref:Uncharacterized protein n=1 Tax=Arthrobotrys oligospora (strain ATCC 24927 / CBS 115.81 / DSM 1491) TaxID=756982 RepID=G1XC03_ARTOA|nr:hypothetical protein AOL_s00078g450 [Orbilia oligospora ATCC 24927]EGX49417.1 hypothetical protein AOL_s00078g450 [Orbilia oligospora ATCC 24927]
MKEKKKDIPPTMQKLTTSSPPTALSFKTQDPNSNNIQELVPPLTPATEVDLQKSCARLVQSTGYSRSFKDAINSSASKNATTTMTTTQRRGNGTIPVVRSYNRAAASSSSSKSGSRTPVGRVVKTGSSSSSAGHRRNGSTVRYEKTSTSKYVPPRRPAPEKALPVARRVRVKREDIGGSEEEGSSSSTVVKEKGQLENREKKSMDTIKEAKSSDGSSVEETRTATTEKNKKVGVKKLVNVMTGYIRQHEASSQPAMESQSSPSMSNEVSPLKEKSNPWESLQIKSSKRKDGTTYIEAIPEHLQTKTSSDEEGKHTGLKRSVSKRLGNAVKEYVKPPHVDRFTPEPLHPISPTSKEESKKTEQQKKYRVTKAMREYVRPSPTDISNVTIEEEGQPPSSQTSKPERTSKYIPAKPPSPVEKPTSPTLTTTKDKKPTSPTIATTKDKDLQKASTESTTSKQPTANNHSHHNPFRLLHDYVKPSMTELPTLQTNIPQAPTHLSPILPSERKPLTTQRSQPSMPYVPPKIRPRGKTLPLDDNPLSPKPTSPNNPSTVAAAAAAATRQGPIFGGGYPAKQDIIATTTTTTTTTSTAGSKDKENRGPISPGFFGRNPGGSGFRIHFSHFLNKQRSDGYDQLE